MQKRLFSLFAVTVLLISLLAGCTKPKVPQNAAAGQQGTPVSAQQTPTQGQTELTAQEGEDIALAHAGFSREEVTRLHTQRDYDDGVWQYEIQFEKDRMEYEYEVHAETGRILSFDKDYN